MFGVLSPGRTPLALFIEGWDEGYTGINGWAIAGGGDGASPDAQDAADAEGLYRLLETEVVPLYFARALEEIRRGWLGVAKNASRTALTRSSAGRMFREYAETLYAPAARDAAAGAGDRSK